VRKGRIFRLFFLFFTFCFVVFTAAQLMMQVARLWAVPVADESQLAELEREAQRYQVYVFFHVSFFGRRSDVFLVI
jgi:hypothetical protein